MATPRFDYPIVYEDRNEVHTSRWRFSGIITRESAANTDRGWLWVTAADVADTVTVNVYKDQACASKVATGTVSIAAIDDGAVKCTLTESNSSGLSGEFYFESYTSDPANAIPIRVTLCTDYDLEAEYVNLDKLPDDVHDATDGMARWCAAATQNVLLLVSQVYKEQLGGFGAPEHRNLLWSSRETPDYRAIASPDQLKQAAVHWALMLAFGACHERAAETMYSSLRDYHDEKRKEAIGSWNLAFNAAPDSDDDADESQAVRFVRMERI